MSQTVNEPFLNADEKKYVAELDSHLYGVLKLHSPENADKKALVEKAVAYFEKVLLDHARQQVQMTSVEERVNTKAPEDRLPPNTMDMAPIEQKPDPRADDERKTDAQSPKINPRVYCMLGHLTLLLEDYTKALSAYQRYFHLDPGYWKDASFLYGLGIVYFHFNAFQWAVKAFRQLLYQHPGFVSAGEVHLRLGIAYKVTKDFDNSYKHFRHALNDATPCSLDKGEIKFHIAHLHETELRLSQAKDLYESLTHASDVTDGLKAQALKQLGWLHFNHDYFGEKPNRETLAIQYLQKSLELDHTSGQTWYYLGRVFSSAGKVHDAFVSYRHSIDKIDASADTWCSIGVLYQQQNQPMDALQAYICAVQLDKSHIAAWTDLGLLYENCNQPKDALTCYLNAYNNAKNAASSSLAPRIKFLQSNLNAIPVQYIKSKPKTLPSIEEAWSLPIPAELTSRRASTTSQQRMVSPGSMKTPSTPTTSGPSGGLGPNASCSGGGGGAPMMSQHSMTPPFGPSSGQLSPLAGEPPNKKRKRKDLDDGPPALTQQQMQMMHYLQQNQATLNGQQHQLLQQFQHQFYAHQQHVLKLQQQQQGMMSPPAPMGVSGAPRMGDPMGISGAPRMGDPMTSPNRSPFPSPRNSGPMMGRMTPPYQQYPGPLGPPPPGPMFSPRSPSVPYGQQRLPQPLAYSQLDQFGATTSALDLGLPKDLHNMSDQELSALLSQKDIASSLAEDLLAQLESGDKDDLSSASLSSHSGTVSQDSVHLNLIDVKEIKSERTSIFNELKIETDVKQEPDLASPRLDISMSASSIIEACKRHGVHGLWNWSMLSDKAPPLPPLKPYPALAKDKLYPPTPIVYLESKRDAYSQELKHYCMSQPVAVIRGMAGALKLDLSLFSTKTLVESNAGNRVEVRTQRQQAPDDNRDQFGNSVWKCVSSRSHTTIAKYAQYQASSFQESLKEEAERAKSGPESDESLSEKAARMRRKIKILKFGTNVDLSDDKQWKAQLQELQKLPTFFRVVSASNMLSHIGTTILGMNSVQLYMKVPGARTPGHQENLCFCSVNINIGPGDCEWFSVPEQYWGVIHSMCERNNINYLTGSWWPALEDLYEEDVPVYRYVQKPGDLVWVNSGTVHWVQAIGWCNNIAWNVGPLHAKHLLQAVERYEWNKLQGFKSIVPLCNLVWNLCKNLRISDAKLYEQLKYSLLRVLRVCQYQLDFVHSLGKDVKWHGKREDETAHYCNECDIEVFCFLYVKELDKKFVVHCLECARRQSCTLSDFVILQERSIEELCEIYDNFQFQAPMLYHK